MKKEYIELAKQIERVVKEAGVKMGTKRAMSMEACILSGYIWAEQDLGHEPAYLLILVQTGRQLTTEVKQKE